MIETLKIPNDRIPVLIGTTGETKRKLYNRFKTNIDIKDTEVSIEGEPVNVFIVKQIIKAIGRGFSPDIAFLLEKDDYQLEVFEITKYTNTKSSMARLKGRVIGRQGKSREKIEELTSSYISVYGKTVSIIARVEFLPLALEAVNMLLGGAKHSTVYKFLETGIKHINP